MRKSILVSTLTLATLAFAGESQAAGAGWGLHTGDTVHSDDNLVYGEVGWPDLSLGFQHGMSDKVDLGVRFSLIYGQNYTTDTEIGMGLRVPIRLALKKSSKVSALLHVDPGLKFDSFSQGGSGLAMFGIWMPLGFELGVHVIPAGTLQFGVDMPFYLNLTNTTYLAVPVQFGFGFEYHIDDHIGVGLNTRFGPTIYAGDNGSNVRFGFVAQAGFMYRL